MGLSYFNSEQRGEMDRLESIPPEKRCYCGWYDLGDCPHCPPDKTCADKLAVRCAKCGNYPDAHTGQMIHTIACPDRA